MRLHKRAGLGREEESHFSTLGLLSTLVNKMSSLTFYCDFLSQPTRAVGLLLEAGKVEYVQHSVKLGKL